MVCSGVHDMGDLSCCHDWLVPGCPNPVSVLRDARCRIVQQTLRSPWLTQPYR